MSIFEPVKKAEAEAESKADSLVGKVQGSKYTARILLGVTVLVAVLLLA